MATIAGVVEAVEQINQFRRRLAETTSPLADVAKDVQKYESAFTTAREQIAAHERWRAEHFSPTAAFSRDLAAATRSVAALYDATAVRSAFEDLRSQLAAATGSPVVFESVRAALAVERLVPADYTKAFRELAALPTAARLAGVYERTALAEHALGRIDAAAFGSRLGLAPADREELAARHRAFGESYRRAVEPDGALGPGLPAPLAELPSAELVHQTALVAATSETTPDAPGDSTLGRVADGLAARAADALTALVAELDPALTRPLAGARAAYASKHEDYERHVLTSYRELITRVLHALSPDERVKGWTRDPADYHNGRPTRRARLRFVTRHIGAAFDGLLTADYEAAVGFFDVLNRGTHGVVPPVTGDQLAAAKNRAEGLLALLLVVTKVDGGRV